MTTLDPRTQLHRWWRAMSKIRAFEEAVAAGHQAGDLPGLLHLAMGGEATAVGVIDALGSADRVYSGHRPHGHFLACGTDPRTLMAELAGRDTGLCRGRGGSMHLMDERAVMATGIVGGTLALALGHALTLAPGGVTVAFFGDGAVQTGAFHETLNMAALWSAPLLLVCENNGWIEFSSRAEHTVVSDVCAYGAVHEIRTAQVDGTDVSAVAAAVAPLLEVLRDGGGPALLECSVSRMRPHYEGDWRAHEEARDPLRHAHDALVGLGADPQELAEQRDADEREAADLLASVLAEDPLPDPAEDPALVFAAQADWPPAPVPVVAA